MGFWFGSPSTLEWPDTTLQALSTLILNPKSQTLMPEPEAPGTSGAAGDLQGKHPAQP